MTFKIDKGVPYPGSTAEIDRWREKLHETLGIMEIGDSVWVDHNPYPFSTWIFKHYPVFFAVREDKVVTPTFSSCYRVHGWRIWRCN